MAAQREVIFASTRVRGLREMIRATDQADRSTRRQMRAALKPIGEIVRAEAQRRFSNYGSAAAGAARFGGTRASHARSAEGYRVRVRQAGVSVEQSIRKTTGDHPEYGSVQMRKGLISALLSERDEVIEEIDKTFDFIVEQFNRP